MRKKIYYSSVFFCVALFVIVSIVALMLFEDNTASAATKSEVPNDVYYEEQWAMHGEYGIDIEGAWAITKGSESVRVGIIDSGIYAQHEELNSQVDIDIGYNFNNPSKPAIETEGGHGTFVAGIVGAERNNNTGISGIAPNSKLVSLKTTFRDFGFGESDWGALRSAVDYATNLWGTQDAIHVLNHSISRFGEETSILNAISKFPGLFVWCAGNEGENVDKFSYIAQFELDNLISVGAINEDGELWEDSNYGTHVDIYAPGENIISTFNTALCLNGSCTYGDENGTHLANGYHYWSGTSFAAPMVSGVAALMLSVNPDLTGAEIKEIILETATPHSIQTPDGEQNVKLLNAEKAVYYARYPEQLVTLNKNGGTGGTSSIIVRYGLELPEDVQAPTRTGYKFLGYYSSSSGGKMYYDENMTPVQEWDQENGGTLYAHWEELVYYTITLDRNGGSGGTTSFKLANGELWPEIIMPIREHYKPKGYYYRTAVNQVYSNSGTFISGYFDRVFDLGRDITLYCEWEPDQFGFKIDWIYFSAENAIHLRSVLLNYDDTYTYSVGNIIEYLGEKYEFSHWQMINNPDNFNAETNPWIEYSEEPVLEFKVADIISQYYPDYDIEEGYICFRAKYNSYLEPSCISAGTMITLADGSQKPVELLTGNEMLLVWNMYTGTFDSAPILCIDSDPLSMYEVIRLAFSDGTTVDVISEHGFFDVDLNKYVYLDVYAADYIGHSFLKQGADGMVQVTLEDVTIVQESTTAYSPVTYGHLCYFVDGMLSVPGGIDGLFNIFEVDGETMMYDADAMAADIEQYGLYTYEELNALVPVPEVMFDAVNGQYLKVAVGKGIITIEQIGELVERYADLFE